MEGQREHEGIRSLVVFLAFIAAFVTPLLAIGEAIASSCLMSCGVPAGTPRHDQSHGLSAAFIVGTVVPVGGIALSVYTKQVGVRLLFGLVLGLTLFIGFLASFDEIQDRATPPRPQVTWCQEHSGGDTTCPGG
jgi:hypothetical protein